MLPRRSVKTPDELPPLPKEPMKSVLLTIVLLTTTFSAARVRAEVPDSPNPALAKVTEGSGRWSFGAGVGMTLYGSDYGLGSTSGAAGLARLGGVGSSGPFGVGLIERSLSPALRLGLSVVGGYSQEQNKSNDRDPNVAPPSRTTSASAGGAVSLRWVLNPGELVEVSPFVALGAHWASREGALTSWTHGSEGEVVARNELDVEGYGLNARLGMVVEYRLLTRLYLRLESHLLRFDRTHAKQKNLFERVDAPSEVGRQTVVVTSLGLGIQPMLQLRILL